MLKTGKSEKGFFTMFSINLKLFQNKKTPHFFKNKYSAYKNQIKIPHKG